MLLLLSWNRVLRGFLTPVLAGGGADKLLEYPRKMRQIGVADAIPHISDRQGVVIEEFFRLLYSYAIEIALIRQSGRLLEDAGKMKLRQTCGVRHLFEADVSRKVVMDEFLGLLNAIVP